MRTLMNKNTSLQEDFILRNPQREEKKKTQAIQFEEKNIRKFDNTRNDLQPEYD
jgi:hypothetical protein